MHPSSPPKVHPFLPSQQHLLRETALSVSSPSTHFSAHVFVASTLLLPELAGVRVPGPSALHSTGTFLAHLSGLFLTMPRADDASEHSSTFHPFLSFV